MQSFAFLKSLDWIMIQVKGTTVITRAIYTRKNKTRLK